MNYFLFLVMVAFFISGAFALFSPAQIKKLTPTIMGWIPNWGWGLASIIVAFLLWFSTGAISSSGSFFIRLLAVFSLIKGCAFIFAPENKIKDLLKWWVATPPMVVRFCGVAGIIVAIFILILL